MISLSQTINNIADWICGRSLIGTVISNSFLAALLLTAIVFIIIYAIYSKPLKQLGGKKMLRMGIYLLIAICTFLFVHYYAVRRRINGEINGEKTKDMFAAIRKEGGNVGTHKVLPRNVADEAEVEAEAEAEAEPDNTPKPDSPVKDDDLDIDELILEATG